MTLKEKLLELMAEDGPNIPMRTLALYCGVSQPMLSLYVRDKANFSPEKEAQVQKGLKEFGDLVRQISYSD